MSLSEQVGTGIVTRGIASQCTRRLILWLLLLAVPAYGLAGALSELLGAQHRHRGVQSAASSMQSWQDFRRAGRAVVHQPAHSHDAWQRHGHSRGDASVVALDGESHETPSTDGASSQGGSFTLWVAARSFPAFGTPAGSRLDWPAKGADRLKKVAAEPLERPPKA